MYEPETDGTAARQCDPRGMITLRGDLGSDAIVNALKSVCGTAVPRQREIILGDSFTVAWMSPDELLIMCDYGAANENVSALQGALAGVHHLVVNVSDARAVFEVTGPGWRDVLGKGAPVDFSAAAFPAGMIRRSRIGQVACAMWMTSDTRAELVCFRSVEAHMAEWLSMATQEGSLPGYY